MDPVPPYLCPHIMDEIMKHIPKDDIETKVSMLIAMGEKQIDSIIINKKIKEGSIIWVKDTKFYWIIRKVTKCFVFLDVLWIQLNRTNDTARPSWPLYPCKLVETDTDWLKCIERGWTTRLSLSLLKKGLFTNVRALTRWRIPGNTYRFEILDSYEDFATFRKFIYK